LSQLESLATLYASAQRLAQSLDPEELAQNVTRACVEVFGARLASLGRAEPDGQVRALNTHGQMTGLLAGLAIRWDQTPEGEGPTGRAIRTGFPVVIANIATDPGFALWREAALAGGLCCTAAFPLVSRGKVFGALNLYSDQPGFFTGERVDFFKAYAHQAAIALENARLLAETRRHLQQMQALHTVDVTIAASLDLQFTFKVLLEQVATQLGVDAADLLLLSPHTHVLEYAAGRGFRTAALQHTRLRLGQGHAGRAALERRIIHIPDWAEEEPDFSRAPLLAGENFRAYYGVPLVAKGYVKGVLEIFHRTPLSPGPEWLTFLEMLAEQAAIAIDNHQLFDGLQRSNLELALAYDATIEGWSYALDLRDKETRDHTRRVTDMTMRLAQALGMGDAELVHVRRGALLHDIGKIGIPDDILLKAGPLTPEEWEIMRRHPVYAYDMLLPIAYLHPALDIPYCHHEKWEGTGYPRGLKSEQIPLAARIFAVVDVWDALRSDRPYRPAWPEAKVREHIRSQAGTHFDPEVAKVFLEIISS
jgi:HD-GYP domain-containing protein (c-di-GMP phosphodiesterase class II)